ncbi:hypothetical protein A3K48_01800 [candidate division WOR-1 bacterium RIFOXYA12_FULL_52_29]|uniref:Uncharacterized protein n=1 Tax=candidate division WOR-1 bacterium RIFOXYC12_FULL_54_18 TaxID=1802584 RepID=A0A1F4T6M5_UNCSA|nr:MAG: hypothetical protein A3K44_01800 [candidate division WOR-1 bacterium RIFOXYA2_FULL_51_19]OGC17316.1 MAG: hypothetical protein A3K48_01800 [candidate division WOR-1 bacterium RIFOXYA12_FULL_52_29]OGC26176.1 MAG: hypothetical protein A3K32_01795 [candidate division WOR-1 bacterium RIFOXYB2_FULL_45_9]OGC27733.1 MAG: hypothetical protein A3K49_01800 [candidate division WOR-1 bacterium RIFOXYC12_FULL_54_18]OGC29976.1 MAG: hypothetical protein A2346_04535 [candidate division WOR-1 bacterium R
MSNEKAFFIDRTDPSAWSLVFANLLTIAMALKFNWSLMELMWIYWAQSVIIGVINFIKLIKFPAIALFFLVHYGIFHLVYLVFLAAFTFGGESPINNGSPIQWSWVWLTAGVFLINHSFSYFYNREKDLARQNPDALFMFPYARIIPMHLTLIFGGLMEAVGPFNFPIIFFLSLKTIADLVMHKKEHA